MPPGTGLDVVPLWGVFVGTLIGIFVAVEVGYQLGQWRNRRSTHEKEAPVGGMVAAELGLLAFLLAITFSIAASRFDTRRQVLLDEANAIGTCYLRADMLPTENGKPVRAYLREYVDVRLAGAREPDSLAGAIARSEQLHTLLWAQAAAAAAEDPRSVQTGLFVESLNDVIDLHATRVQAAVRTRLPPTIWFVLFGVAALSFLAMGYHHGLSSAGRTPAVVALALGFAVVIWMTVDLDRPHQGTLRVSQQTLIDLQKSMSP